MPTDRLGSFYRSVFFLDSDNRPAADDQVPVVEDDGLPRRDGTLRLCEVHPHAAVFHRG